MKGLVALKVACPECHHSLMDSTQLINNKESIKLKIALPGDGEGTIWLSSIYGDYNYTSDLEIPDREIVQFICPQCGKDLKRKKVECDLCQAPIVSFNCSVGGRVSICSRNNCKNHYVVFEDLDTAIRRFYNEYGA